MKTFVLFLLSLVQANVIEALNYQCVPCIAFGGYYCPDDPWKVNFNADKCYEYAVDRINCVGFNYTNNATNCIDTILTQSSACNVSKEIFKLCEQPTEIVMELEPRSSCGLEVIAYSSKLTITNMFPMTVYQQIGNKTVNHTDVISMVWGGDRDSDDGCLYSECSNDFII